MQGIFTDEMISLDLQAGHKSLRTLDDSERDEQVALLSLVVVVHRRSHLDIAESVGDVQCFNGICVVAHQALTETATGGERCGLKLQAALEQFPAEVLVAFKGDTGETE